MTKTQKFEGLVLFLGKKIPTLIVTHLLGRKELRLETTRGISVNSIRRVLYHLMTIDNALHVIVY